MKDILNNFFFLYFHISISSWTSISPRPPILWLKFLPPLRLCCVMYATSRLGPTPYTNPFLRGRRPLVPLFWISSDVCSGFQNQSGFRLIRFFEVHSLRSTSDATHANLLAARHSQSLPHMHQQRYDLARIWTVKHPLRRRTRYHCASDPAISLLRLILLSTWCGLTHRFLYGIGRPCSRHGAHTWYSLSICKYKHVLTRGTHCLYVNTNTCQL